MVLTVGPIGAPLAGTKHPGSGPSALRARSRPRANEYWEGQAPRVSANHLAAEAHSRALHAATKACASLRGASGSQRALASGNGQSGGKESSARAFAGDSGRAWTQSARGEQVLWKPGLRKWPSFMLTWPCRPNAHSLASQRYISQLATSGGLRPEEDLLGWGWAGVRRPHGKLSNIWSREGATLLSEGLGLLATLFCHPLPWVSRASA